MKTVKIIYLPTVGKSREYSFLTEEDIQVNDMLTSEEYLGKVLLVTDVVNEVEVIKDNYGKEIKLKELTFGNDKDKIQVERV
jgi:hypothetical protein